MSITEYATIVPSSDNSEVRITTEYVTIVQSTYISVLYAAALSSTEYVTIVPSSVSKEYN